jgi:H/ACA ribonucleoprotein complex subunit 4
MSQAKEKKMMIKEGKLDKYGRINENTPESWKTNYTDYGQRASTSTMMEGVAPSSTTQSDVKGVERKEELIKSKKVHNPSLLVNGC